MPFLWILGLVLVSTSSLRAAEPLLPDLIVKEEALKDSEVDTSTRPGRVLLRFSNAVGNVGFGPLEVRGGAVNDQGQEVVQRVYRSDQSAYDRKAGTFTFHPEHDHVHFDSFASYELRKVMTDNGVGPIVAESAKVSFCLRDSDPVAGEKADIFSDRYKSCGTEKQGISLGWADHYKKSLPGQWIDITDVPDGLYWLQSTVDPEGRIQESNRANNTARVRIDLRRGPSREQASVPLKQDCGCDHGAKVSQSTDMQSPSRSQSDLGTEL